MTRDEQLKLCKVCKNQKFDPRQGIVCGLTGAVADFAVSCDSFIEDSVLKSKAELKLKENEVLNRTAGQGKRFANYLLDLLFFMILSFIFGVMLAIIMNLVSPEYLSVFEEDNALMDYLLGFILAMIYYTVFEFTTGRTLAKFITKTKVITEDGERPDFGTILIRSVCRFIPFEALSFLGSDSSGLHDRLSKTKVIEV